MPPRTINRIRSLIQDYTHGGQPVTFLPVHVIDLAEDGYIKPHVDSIKFSGGGHVCTHVVHHKAARHGDKTILVDATRFRGRPLPAVVLCNASSE